MIYIYEAAGRRERERERQIGLNYELIFVIMYNEIRIFFCGYLDNDNFDGIINIIINRIVAFNFVSHFFLQLKFN